MPQPLQAAVGQLLCRPQRLHLGQRLLEFAVECIGHRARLRFLLAEGLERRIRLCGADRFVLERQPVALRAQAQALIFQLLDARGLDLGALTGGAQIPIEFLPALLPGGQLLVCAGKRGAGERLAARARLDQRLQLSISVAEAASCSSSRTICWALAARWVLTLARSERARSRSSRPKRMLSSARVTSAPSS